MQIHDCFTQKNCIYPIFTTFAWRPFSGTVGNVQVSGCTITWSFLKVQSAVGLGLGLQSEKYIKLQIVWIAQSGVNWCEERLPRVYNNVDSVTHNRTFELRTLTQVEFLSFLAKCNRVRSSGSRFLGPWSSAPGSSVFSLPLHSGIGYGWDLALITSYIKCIIICCIVLL